MNQKVLLAALALLLTLVFSGCIAEIPLKKVSNGDFEFHYLELDNWITLPIKDPDSLLGSRTLFGGNNVALVLAKKVQPKPSIITIAYQLLPSRGERDLNRIWQGMQAAFRRNFEADIEEARIIYKNYHPWGSFKAVGKNYTYVVMMTYCGRSYVQVILFTTKEHETKDKNKLREIMDTFYCKVQTNFKEGSLQ